MDHDWQFFAVQHERATRAVVICTRCGEARYSVIAHKGGRRLALAGDCSGDRLDADGGTVPPEPLVAF